MKSLPAHEADTKHNVQFWTSEKIDLEHYFPFQLLKLALTKTDLDYDLSVATIEERGMTTEELELLMAKPNNPQIHNIKVAGTSITHEKNMNAVYFPIFRGLLGYRLFAIREEDQEKFAKITDEITLKHLIALQGGSWVDTDILRDAGYRVKTGQYADLFPWLHEGNGDYFPRGITELDEIDTQPFDNIVLEENLYIYYPLVMYFFVSPGDNFLAEKLKNGLVLSMYDGSYDELFKQNTKYLKMIERAHIGERTGFFLENGNLSDKTQDLPSEYLYSLQDVVDLVDAN